MICQSIGVPGQSARCDPSEVETDCSTDALYCELGTPYALVTDRRPEVIPQEHCRPLVYCASASRRPIRAVMGALGGAVHTADRAEHRLIDTSRKGTTVVLMA